MKQSDLKWKEGAGYTRPDPFRARPPKQSSEIRKQKHNLCTHMEAASSDET